MARSRARDLQISLLASIEGAIVTECIINRTFSDWKTDEESNGNIYILFHSLFRASFKFLCTNVTHLPSLLCL